MRPPDQQSCLQLCFCWLFVGILLLLSSLMLPASQLMLLPVMLLVFLLALLLLTLILRWRPLGPSSCCGLRFCQRPAVAGVTMVIPPSLLLVFPPGQFSLVLLWVPHNSVLTVVACLKFFGYILLLLPLLLMIISLLLLVLPSFWRPCCCCSAPAVVSAHAVASIPSAVNIPFPQVLSNIAFVGFPSC